MAWIGRQGDVWDALKKAGDAAENGGSARAHGRGSLAGSETAPKTYERRIAQWEA